MKLETELRHARLRQKDSPHMVVACTSECLEHRLGLLAVNWLQWDQVCWLHPEAGGAQLRGSLSASFASRVPKQYQLTAGCPRKAVLVALLAVSLVVEPRPKLADTAGICAAQMDRHLRVRRLEHCVGKETRRRQTDRRSGEGLTDCSPRTVQGEPHNKVPCEQVRVSLSGDDDSLAYATIVALSHLLFQ